MMKKYGKKTDTLLTQVLTGRQSDAKMDRIKNHAPDIRKLHFVNMKYQTKEYRKYFQNILSATFEGKMKHDDGIDSTAQLCDMIYGNKRMARAEAIQNPFSFGRRY